MSLHYKNNNLIKYSFKLDQVHKAALPNAIRFTLNDAAKDVKFNTLLKHAKKQFDVKKPSFFRAFSRFQQAKGFKISQMFSVAGMVKGPNSKSKASTEIGQQQIAGVLYNKSFLAAKNQRTSKGLVKKSYKTVRNIKPISTKKGLNFFADAQRAKESKRPLLIRKNNKGVLVKVNRIRKGSKKRKAFVFTTPIASYKRERRIDLRTKRPFLNDAAIESGKKINSFYIKNAEKQIKRFRN